ncbi:hypothetical protein ACWEHT_09535, partial [Streptomyces sp. NPDC004646]
GRARLRCPGLTGYGGPAAPGTVPSGGSGDGGSGVPGCGVPGVTGYGGPAVPGTALLVASLRRARSWRFRSAR